MSTGDKTLSFVYPIELSKEIKEEGYIRNKTDEFVIKEISTQGKWKSIKAKLNVDDLEGKVFESFDTTNETIKHCINLALAGTGWSIGICEITKRRTVRKTNSSSWDIIQEAKSVYRCEVEFDTLNKKVNIYEKRGSDKGVYFLDTLNLKSLSVQSDSYDFYTRIIAKGKDDLRVVLENFQYSSKIKTYIWKDERYTDIESLTEDAEAKLNDLSKPYRAYSATVIDLANINKEDYEGILNYSLGDVITLVSKENGIKEKQRIIKIVEYPDEPNRNTCEIANTTLTFEEIQKEFQNTTDTVNNITTDNGTIDGSAINGISTEQIYDFEASVGKITDLTVVNARIDELYAKKANMSELNTVIANVAELNATKANITDLNVINTNIEKLIAADATINNALIGKADITELNAVKGTINVLESDTANIKNLLAGNVSGESGQLIHLTANNVVIADAVIKDLIAANISVEDLKAGTISTNKFRIVSDSGKMLIADNTIQIRDNNRVRVQIGKDGSNDYNMYVWDSQGKLMFDATGLKADGIKNKIIRDDMISDTANIDGAKININSLITEINKDTNTSVIKSSKVQIDSLKQTLDVAFNSLKTQADSTKSLTESHSTTIGVMQGQISTAINNTQIVKDGKTILLKDDYNRTVTKVDSINSTIGTHTTKINELTGNISSVDTKVNSIQRDLEGTKSTVSNHSTQISDLNSTISTQGASISQLKNQIALKVEATDITTAINKINIGGRNLVSNSNFEGATSNAYGFSSRKVIGGLKNNTTYTFTVNGRSNPNGNTEGKHLKCYIYAKDWSSQWSFNISETVDTTRSLTFTTGNGIEGKNVIVEFYWFPRDGDRTGNATVNWCTLVEGNKAMIDWASAPEDIDESIALVDSKVTTTSNKVAAIETNLSSITQRVSATETNITSITTDFNNMQIGVRNLLIGGKSSCYTSYNTITSQNGTKEIVFKWTASYAGSTFTLSNNGFKPKGTYTISGYITVNGAIPTSKYFIGLASTYGNNLKENYYDSSTGYFRITQDYPGTSIWILHAPTTRSSGSSDIVILTKLKLEKGDKATDWTQAPEDTDNSIANVQTQITNTSNKVATIETNLNSITQKVSSVENTTATINGNVTNLTNRVSTAESKLTSTSLTTTISSAINEGTSSINTTQFVMDKSGLIIKNGALTIKNKAGTTVFSSDTSGNLKLAGSITSGATITGGTLKSSNNDMYFDLNGGYILLYNDGTKIGQTNKNRITGTSIYGVSNGAEYGKYSTLSAKTSSSDTTYSMMMTVSGSDLTSYISKGVNLGANLHTNNWNFRMGKSSELCWRQSGSNYDSFITEGAEGMLRLYGDNGMYLGYREGANNSYVIAIRESGSHTYPKVLSMFNSEGDIPSNGEYAVEITAPLKMRGQTIDECSNIKTLGLEIAEPLAFYSDDSEETTTTYTVTKNNQNIVEFVGSAEIVSGEVTVPLPDNIVFRNYVVLLTAIGSNRNVSLVEKSDDSFKLIGDNGTVDYVIKFESVDYSKYMAKSISIDAVDNIQRSEDDLPKVIELSEDSSPFIDVPTPLEAV